MAGDPTTTYAEDRRAQELREALQWLENSLVESPAQSKGEESTATPRTGLAALSGEPAEGVPSTREFTRFRRSVEALKPVGRDVARGATEAPGQVLRGLLTIPDDLRQTLQDLSDLGDAIHEASGRTERLESDPELEQALAEWTGKLADVVGPADSVTGDLVQKMTNFLGAFVPLLGPAGRLTKLAGGTGVPGRIGRDALAGAAADFLTVDVEPLEAAAKELEGQEGLGPALEAFFAGGPEDTAVERRLRQSLIGSGLGVGADVLGVGFRALRSWRRAQGAREALTEAGVAVQEGRPASRLQISELGAKGPRIQSTPGGADALRESLREVEERFAGQNLSRQQIRRLAEAETTAVEINFDRIDTPEDVDALMQDATDLFSESITKARRGTRSNEATQEAADLLGLSLDDVLARRQGQALNAEEALAFRRVHATTATKLYEIAQEASLSPGDEVLQFKLRKVFAVFHAVNKQMLGARAEAGRSLQQWNIVAGSDEMRARMLSNLLDARGGEEVSAALAQRVVDLVETGGSTAKLARMAERGAFARTADAVKEAYVLGKLWTPSTHAVNMTSNTLVALQQVYERAAARGITQLAGREGVEAGEALAMTHGFVRGIRSAFRLGEADRVLREQAMEMTGSRSKLDVRTNAISSESFGLRTAEGDPTTMGKFVDYYGAFTRAPGTLLQVEDEFFKTIGYTMELHAQAMRSAAREGAEKGWTKAQTEARYAELLADPPESLRLDAADAALYNTFQQKSNGRAMKLAFAARRNIPGAFLILPFVRTPINILRYTFERTPFAPLVGQWKEDIKRGGAARDLALARMATGSAITLAMFDLVYEGHASGGLSTDRGVREAQLRQGLQPDSLIVGEPGEQTTLRLSRLDPLGFQLSVMGTMAEVLKSRELEEEDLAEVSETMALIAVATAEAAKNKTWFTGVSRLFAMLEDPKQFGGSFIRQTGGGLVPHDTLLLTLESLAQEAGITPEGLPDTATLWNEIERRTLVLAQNLPRKRDLWGRPIVVDAVNKLSPARIEELDPEPIDVELKRLGSGPLRIARKTDFNGGPLVTSEGIAPARSAPVNFRMFPNVYETYVQLAGGGTSQGLVHPATGKRLLPFLNDLVEGRAPQSGAYQIASDTVRAQQIRTWVGRYRELAQREIVQDPRQRFQGEEFQAFRSYLARKKLQGQADRMPQFRLEPEGVSP